MIIFFDYLYHVVSVYSLKFSLALFNTLVGESPNVTLASFICLHFHRHVQCLPLLCAVFHLSLAFPAQTRQAQGTSIFSMLWIL